MIKQTRKQRKTQKGENGNNTYETKNIIKEETPKKNQELLNTQNKKETKQKKTNTDLENMQKLHDFRAGWSPDK
jgi:hypothetical protein